MSGSDGSTTLTDEQADLTLAQFGVRYRVIQTNADVPSRRERRAAGERARRFGNGRRDVSAKATLRWMLNT